ncbi:MAG: PaaI family thioesterase [Ottowia sp.]|nr:PaaI family thioesterase [Ottowia sp.]
MVRQAGSGAGGSDGDPKLGKLARLGGSFAGRVGVQLLHSADGVSRSRLPLEPWHFNNHQVVHGGVLFTLVDTCMGAALYSQLAPDELCATIDVHISYLNAVTQGPLQCESRVLKRGKRVAHIEASVRVADRLMATATGNFAIFARQPLSSTPKSE